MTAETSWRTVRRVAAPGQSALLLRRLGDVGAGLLRQVLAAVVGLVVLLLLAAGGLVWRLEQGPVDVTGVARWLVRMQAPEATLGRVTVTLAGAGDGRALLVAVSDAAGRMPVAGSVHSLTATLPLTALLGGQVVPQEVTADGVHIQLSRAAFDGSGQGGPPRLPSQLAGLRHVRLTDVRVEVTDAAAGQAVQLRLPTADLARGADGTLRGQADATIGLGALSLRLALQASQGPGGVQLALETSPVSPAAVAQAVPALAAAAALDAPTGLRLAASFDPAFTLLRATVHAEAGAGSVQLPAKHGTATGHFAALTLDAEGTLQAVTLRSLRLVLAPPSGNPPTTVVIAGDAARSGDRFTTHVAVAIDRLLAPDLASIWPAGVGGDARDWLTENITAGLVHDGHLSFTLTGRQDGDDIDMTQAGGTLTGDDVSVWWLRPVPPAEHGHVEVVWQNPDTMLLTVTGARQGAIASPTTTVRLTGLAGKDQVAFITANLAGPLRDVIALLQHPRLKLLSTHSFPIANPSGAVTDVLTIKLPLEAKVTIDQVGIHAHGRVTDAHLGGLVAGRDLDHGDLVIDVTNDGLNVSGTAQVAHLPGKLTDSMDFRAGPPDQIVQHATAAVRITARDAQAAGLGEVGLDGGFVLGEVDYTERRNGAAAIRLHAVITEAAFKPPLGWSKPVGAAGFVDGRVLLSHGRLVGLDGVRAEAPGLSVVARSDIVAGRPSVVHIERGEVGRSSATGTIALPQRQGEPFRVTLSGPQLDLEGKLGGSGSAGAPSRSGPSGTPYLVDLQFQRLLFGPDRALGPLAVTAQHDGKRLVAARLTLSGTDPVLMTLHATPDGRALHAEAANLGALLRTTGLAAELEGGQMTLDGRFEDRLPGDPFAGTMDLRGFRVHGAPVAGKVLQGLTIYGLGDALRGPGLVFDRLHAPLRLAGSVLDLTDARAFSSSLGLTASGQLDFGRKLVALRGTIVPAYFFNALPGRIPLIGPLFRTGQGSGLFAADFGLSGSLTDPSVSFNPLSLLTPGITRRLFGLFD